MSPFVWLDLTCGCLWVPCCQCSKRNVHAPLFPNSLIRISLKSWHMLVNLCFHIFLTCVVFVGGITQTRNASVCQAVSQTWKVLGWKNNMILENNCVSLAVKQKTCFFGVFPLPAAQPDACPLSNLARFLKFWLPIPSLMTSSKSLFRSLAIACYLSSPLQRLTVYLNV